MRTFRRPLMVSGALFAAACSGDSPAVTPSTLGPPAAVRLSATSGGSTGHEHNHAAATVISIVGSAGPAAYLPNPLQIAMGSMLTWMNSDLVAHNIVLDDGTVVGMVNPGEMTPPMMMNTPTVAYHCSIHRSMTGVIADPSVATPQPAPAPTPDPMPAPPSDDYYPYPEPGDGYYDY